MQDYVDQFLVHASLTTKTRIKCRYIISNRNKTTNEKKKKKGA